ncbi:MAG: hypothetical protein FWG10_02050 [Eubacteriaceae bacterium]|nr:hypothetical protein [Eubacteriaceae bacterium]
MAVKTYKQAIEEAIAESMAIDGAVVVLGARGLDFPEVYRSRVLDMPIGSNIAPSASLGLAMTGANPVLFLKGEHMLRYLDVIGNEISVIESMYNSQFDSGMVIILDIGYLPQTGPQLSQSFESVFLQFPGLTVVYPSNASDAKALLMSSIRLKKPVIFLLNKSLMDTSSDIADNPIPVGKSKVVLEGKDITIVAYGDMVNMALRASSLAAESGLMCEVIDLMTIHPIDMDPIVESIQKTGKIMIVHEARKTGGIGSEIAALIAESEALFFLDSKVMRVTSKDVDIPYNRNDYFKTVPNEEDILKAIIQLSTGE